MRRLILCLMVFLISCLPVTAAEFLSSARAGGMGFSYFILADDPSGAVYNPAGVGFVGGWQSYLMLDLQNDYEYTLREEAPYNGRLAVVYPIRDFVTTAVSANQSGSLEKTTGIPTTNHIAMTFAKEVAPGFSTGASLKYLYETWFGQRSAVDLDLGIIYRSSLGIIGAAAFENVLRARLTPDYLGYQEHLARRERVGLGYILRAQKWQALFSAATQFEESGISQKFTTALFNFGSEWWFLPEKSVSFALRSGVTFGRGVRWDIKSDYTGLYAGLSLNFKIGSNDLRLDYGYSSYPYETLDGSNPGDHTLAISCGWGGISDYSFKGEGHASYEEPAPYRPPPKPEPQPSPQVEPLKESRKDLIDIDKDTDFEAKSYLAYDVEMDVSDVSAANIKHIIFYLKPQKILVTNNWSLYVFRAKIKNWSDEQIERWALRVITGRGVPPLNIVWDGISDNGKLLPPGRYFYILTAEDPDGNRYATKWHVLNLE